MSNASYDAVVGADASAINSTVASVYSSLYPRIFKGSVSVQQFEVSTVDYDIQAAPSFDLNQSQLLADYYRAYLGGQIEDSDLDAAVNESTQFSITGLVSKVSLTIHYMNNVPATQVPLATMSLAVQVEVNTDNTFSLHLVTGTVTIEGDATLSALLTNIMMPTLIDYLNTNVLKPIKLPAISFLGLSLSTPAVLAQNNTLVAFTALQPTPLNPPTSDTWPSNAAFAGVDATLLGAIANAELSQIHISEDVSFSMGSIIICDLGIDAHVDMSFGQASFTFIPGSGGNITATASFSGGASLTAKCGHIHAPFGARISVNATATIQVNLVGTSVIVTFERLNKITPDISFQGIPKILNGVVSDLLDALSSYVIQLIAQKLSGYTFKAYSLPGISFKVGQMTFDVSLNNLAVNTVAGSDGIVVLLVQGNVSVDSPPQYLTANTDTKAQAQPVFAK